MLMNQHILIFEDQRVKSKMIGIIDTKCNVVNLVKKAFDEAEILCEQNYTIAPELDLQIHNSVDPTKAGSKKPHSSPIFMVYPPMHLKFILVEIFKNSMRATLESKGTFNVPPVQVLVAKGKQDVTIKISDQVSTDEKKCYFYLFDQFLLLLGRWHSAQSNHQNVSLFVFHCSKTRHGTQRHGSICRIWLRPSTKSVIC